MSPISRDVIWLLYQVYSETTSPIFGRLKALRNMIEAAGDLIAAGDYEVACQQLQDAYDRCDGEFPPPDFVEGDAADDLATMILELMADLVC